MYLTEDKTWRFLYDSQTKCQSSELKTKTTLYSENFENPTMNINRHTTSAKSHGPGQQSDTPTTYLPSQGVFPTVADRIKFQELLTVPRITFD